MWYSINAIPQARFSGKRGFKWLTENREQIVVIISTAQIQIHIYMQFTFAVIYILK